jgi:hypothetical protein
MIYLSSPLKWVPCAPDGENMKRLLLLGMLLPLIACSAEDEKKGTDSFIQDSGHVVHDGYITEERFPLTKRHWYQTNKGGAAAIFIDIPAVTVMNGLCISGSAFKHHESGGLIMKCFNSNAAGKMHKALLFKTKDHHYTETGSCSAAGKYTMLSHDNCTTTAGRMPMFWYSIGDVGDPISVEECQAITDKASKYNFDFVCQ